MQVQVKHSLELGQVWCACRLGRKGIPSGNASHSERTFSYIRAHTHIVYVEKANLKAILQTIGDHLFKMESTGEK